MKSYAERSSPTGLTAATGRTAPDAGVQAYSKLQLDEQKPKRSSRGGKGRPRKEKSREDLSGRSSSPDETPALLDVETEPVPSGGVPLASHDLRLGGRHRSPGGHPPRARHEAAGIRGSRGGGARRERLDRAAAWPRPRLVDGRASGRVEPRAHAGADRRRPERAARGGSLSPRSRSPPPPPPPTPPPYAIAVAPRLYVPAVPVPPSRRGRRGGDPSELTAPAERIEEELTDGRGAPRARPPQLHAARRARRRGRRASARRGTRASLSSPRQEHEHALRRCRTCEARGGAGARDGRARGGRAPALPSGR